jgi:hypothetical protein
MIEFSEILAPFKAAIKELEGTIYPSSLRCFRRLFIDYHLRTRDKLTITLGEQYPTLPLVLKHIYSLRDFCINRIAFINAHRGAGVRERPAALLASLRTSLDAMIDELPDEAYLAALLDPRFFDTFIPLGLREEKWALLQEVLDSIQAENAAHANIGGNHGVQDAMDLDPPEDVAGPVAGAPAQPHATRSRPLPVVPKKTYEEIIREKQQSKGVEAAAAAPYRTLAPINPKLPIGDWWRSHQSVYPLHALAARRYTCIPATSAPSERLFSTGGRVLEKRRAALKPDTVRDIVIIHDNIDKLDRVRFPDFDD